MFVIYAMKGHLSNGTGCLADYALLRQAKIRVYVKQTYESRTRVLEAGAKVQRLPFVQQLRVAGWWEILGKYKS